MPVLAANGDSLNFSRSGLSGAFDTVYDFSVTNPLGVVGAFNWLNSPGLSTIIGFSATLQSAGGSAIRGDTVSDTGPISQSGLYQLLLAPGSYALKVSGTGASAGYFYGSLAAVPAVPENATWLMMCAGLSLIVACSRRRTRGRDTPLDAPGPPVTLR